MGKELEIAGALCATRNAVMAFSNVKTPATIHALTFLQAERFENRGKPPILRGKSVYNGKTAQITIRP